MRIIDSFRVAVGAVCVCTLAAPMMAQGAGRVKAQSDGSVAKAPSDSVTVVAGPHYQAGALYRWFFGSTYRDLWTTPMRVPVFDFQHLRGRGSHPTKEARRQSDEVASASRPRTDRSMSSACRTRRSTPRRRR